MKASRRNSLSWPCIHQLSAQSELKSELNKLAEKIIRCDEPQGIAFLDREIADPIDLEIVVMLVSDDEHDHGRVSELRTLLPPQS